VRGADEIRRTKKEKKEPDKKKPRVVGNGAPDPARNGQFLDGGKISLDKGPFNGCVCPVTKPNFS
jgi:hypothetical protein